MTADPAARGPWHDVRSFCNRTSLTTSQSIDPPRVGVTVAPTRGALVGGAAADRPSPSPGGPATPAARGPRPEGPAHLLARAPGPGRTHVRARALTYGPARLYARAPGPQRRAGSSAGGRASSGWRPAAAAASAAARHVTGSPRRRPGCGCARPAVRPLLERRARPRGASSLSSAFGTLECGQGSEERAPFPEHSLRCRDFAFWGRGGGDTHR